MRLTRFHMPTIKEAPKDAELASHKYMIRGGFIRMLAAGIYDFMPLGVRVLHKIMTITREELNRAGALEVLLPAVQPAELWMESKRWEHYGPELLRFSDRHGRSFCFGPTHEEVITDLVRRDIRSYKELPVNLYQIQAKFRDEMKPRGALMRAREFIMKDGYSFDANEEGAKKTYREMYDAYCRIFWRCGLDFRAVEADTGNIGGSMSHEFQVVAETGEDYVMKCPECDYTVNRELAPLGPVPSAPSLVELPGVERVHTPEQRSVEEVAAFLGVSPDQVVKTLIYLVDGEPMAVLVRGDHELSEVKLRRALRADVVGMADDVTVESVSGAAVGFAGPQGLTVPIVADHGVEPLRNVVVGANEDFHHLRNVNPGRDFVVSRYEDLREAQDADPCQMCGKGQYQLFRGIEVGHVFFLGDKYSRSMDCTFLDETGKPRHAVMGCYGIGITRIMSATIEQNHDEAGMIWPVPIAPFEVVILALQLKDESVAAAAEELYEQLQRAGVDVALDDRDIRPGVKFNDADLIGIPCQVIVGKNGAARGVVEVKDRASGERNEVGLSEAVEWVATRIAERRSG